MRVAGGATGQIPRYPPRCAFRPALVSLLALTARTGEPTAHPLLTGHAQDKLVFCARRFDGTFCQLAISGLGNYSAADRAVGVCELMEDGCAPTYRNHLLAEASAQCAAQRRPPALCGKAAAAAYGAEIQRCGTAHTVAHAAVCGLRLERPGPTPRGPVPTKIPNLILYPSHGRPLIHSACCPRRLLSRKLVSCRCGTSGETPRLH